MKACEHAPATAPKTRHKIRIRGIVPDVVRLPDGSIPLIPRGGEAVLPVQNSTKTNTNTRQLFHSRNYGKVAGPQCAQVCTALTSLGVEPPKIDVFDFGLETGRIVEKMPTP